MSPTLIELVLSKNLILIRMPRYQRRVINGIEWSMALSIEEARAFHEQLGAMIKTWDGDQVRASKPSATRG